MHVASFTRRTSLGRIQYLVVLRSNVVGGVHTASRAEAAVPDVAPDVASESAFRMAAYAPESANTAASNVVYAPAKRSDWSASPSSGHVADACGTRGTPPPSGDRGEPGRAASSMSPSDGTVVREPPSRSSRLPRW